MTLVSWCAAVPVFTSLPALAEFPTLEMKIWQDTEHPKPQPRGLRGDAILEQLWVHLGCRMQGSGLQGFCL